MNRLQERRLSLGLSQPEVSQRLKAVDPRMDVGMVSRFERGVCLPTAEILRALETVLQAPRTELFTNDDLDAYPRERTGTGGRNAHHGQAAGGDPLRTAQRHWAGRSGPEAGAQRPADPPGH